MDGAEWLGHYHSSDIVTNMVPTSAPHGSAGRHLGWRLHCILGLAASECDHHHPGRGQCAGGCAGRVAEAVTQTDFPHPATDRHRRRDGARRLPGHLEQSPDRTHPETAGAIPGTLRGCKRRFQVVWSGIRPGLSETDIEAALRVEADPRTKWSSR
jgi:hypothetical protein